MAVNVLTDPLWYVSSYYTSGTIDTFSQLTGTIGDKARWKSLCVAVPADTLTFTVRLAAVASSRRRVLEHEPSIGQGPPGHVTKEPGRQAYFETCNNLVNFTIRKFSYSVAAASGPVWLSYANPDKIAAFVDVLVNRSGVSCVGLWNPEWDDFAGVCGEKPFPLTRAVFTKLTAHN